MLFVGLTSSCERPFVEEEPPNIQIVSPDPDFIQSDRNVVIKAKISTNFRVVQAVTLNSNAMSYDGVEDVWLGTTTLNKGPNAIVVEAKDDAGLTTRAETTLLNFRSETSTSSSLPAGVGGHQVIDILRSTGDSYLLVGGASSTLSNASTGIFEFTVTGNSISFNSFESSLNRPRAGHSLTKMLDGSILVIGGSQRAEARDLNDLVETVERINLETNQVEVVPTSGFPIRRSRHASISILDSNNREFIYLYGGQGDIRYGDTPRLGIRSDLRLFEYRNDSLVAIPPEPIGTRILDAVAGHSLVALSKGNGSGFGDYLISSTEFDGSDNFSSIHSRINFSNSSIERGAVDGTFIVPRTEYAAERISDGRIVFFGGRGFTQNSSLGSTEMFYAPENKYFLFPQAGSLSQERWDFSATKLVDDRILLMGGFDNSGRSVRNTEFFTIF